MADDGAVAIVGVACRFPGAPDVERFWANLRAGVDSISRFSREELLAAGVDPALAGRPDYVPARGTLEGAERFDWAFFGYSPAEAATIDPQQRVFLECAAAALDDAGIDPTRFPGWIGAFAGADLTPPPAAGDDPVQGVLGSEKDYLATRVAYKLGLRGPAITVQTACSTALVAVHMGCQSLLGHESDAVVAGGVSVRLPQVGGYLHREGDILSRDGRCRPFDATASGTVTSSGVGVVVLKRLDDALRAGDRVVAVIRGSAVNNDGGEKIGFTAPSIAGQRDVIRLALAQAGVEAGEIGYVEAHGTGTRVGDPIEVAALASAFRESGGAAGACWLGAVKGNIGHTGAAAGAASLIKAACMLERRELVPTAHFERPNPALELETTPFRVCTELRPWDRRGRLLAGVSSFGIGGTNVHAVLEAPPPPRAAARASGPRALCVSAASPEALDRLRAGLAARLEGPGAPGLADAAWTLAAGRRRFAYRLVAVAASPAGAAAALREASPGPAAEPAPAVAFLFPGQGTLRPGAGAAAHRLLPEFRAQFDRAAGIVRERFGLDLADLLRPDAGAVWLRDTERQQLGLFALGYALGSQLRAWGVEPAGMLGHSVGEYTAAALAGVWSLPDALALVRERGRAMRETEPGRMLALPAAGGEGDRALAAHPQLALAVDGPEHAVVAGPAPVVEALRAELRARRVPCQLLETERAFHSPLMGPAAEALRAAAAAVPSAPPALPFVSNLTGGWAGPGVREPEHWAAHLCGTVRLSAAIDTLLAGPCRALVELGPGETMSAAVRRHPRWDGSRAAVALLGRSPAGEEERLLRSLGRLWERGVPVDWTALFAGPPPLRCSLPAHPFEPRPVDAPRRERREPDRAPGDAPVPPAEVVGRLGWEAPGPRLSGRPDLAARLDGWCAGLAGRLVLDRAGLRPGATARWEAVTGRLDPGRRLPGLVDFLLVTMAAEGWLTPAGAGLAVAGDVEERVAAALRLEDGLGELPGLRRLLHRCADACPAVLDGRCDPLSVLYPGGEDSLLGPCLVDNAVAVGDAEPCLDALRRALRELAGRRGGLRVLEAGAGRGRLCWPLLESWPRELPLEYWFTDVSPLLVAEARARGRALGLPGLRCSTFDIGRDPAGQGLASGAFDAVVAYNALHLAPSVPAAAAGLVRLLGPGGWLGLVELTAAARWTQLVWGLAPGWWERADLDAAGWRRVLEDAGLGQAVTLPRDGGGDHALVLAARPAAGPAPRSPHPMVRPEDAPERPAPERGDALAGIWRETLGLGPAGPDDDFFERGGDSLTAVRLLGRIDDRLGVRVPVAAFAERPTFGHLAGLVLSAAPAGRPHDLVAFGGAGPGTPLFLAAPATGSSLCYRDVAARLGSPCYGLEAPGLHEGRPAARMEELAAHHVRLVGTVSPGGPHVLGGWSTGAMVAHEMARQLAASGDRVALLVLIDGYVPDTGGRPLGTVPRYLAGGLRHLLHRGLGLRSAVYRAAITAMLRYAPRPAPCRAVLFQTGLDAAGRERLRRRLAPLYEGGLDVLAAPGGHWTVLGEGHAGPLAAAIAAAVAQADA